MSFVLERTLKLDKYGESWKGCYIKMRETNVNEIRKTATTSEDVEEGSTESLDSVVKVLKDCFIEGKAFNGKEIVNLKVTDIELLPYSIYKECIDFLLSPGSN